MHTIDNYPDATDALWTDDTYAEATTVDRTGLVPTPPRTYPVFHVHLSDGSTYGVAALDKSTALTLVHGRMLNDGHKANMVRAERVAPASEGWEYGTTLAY